MYITNKISIYKRSEDRKKEYVYKNIDAQIYKKTLRSQKWDRSESDTKEFTIVLIEASNTNVRPWQKIVYRDDFWERTLNIVWEPEMIWFVHTNKIIQLRCELG